MVEVSTGVKIPGLDIEPGELAVSLFLQELESMEWLKGPEKVHHSMLICVELATAPEYSSVIPHIPCPQWAFPGCNHRPSNNDRQESNS